MTNLSETRPGQRVRLTHVAGERSYRRRLLEMGFLPGTEVEVLRRVELGRLIELFVRGSRISLRLDEAASVHCEGGDGQ